MDLLCGVGNVIAYKNDESGQLKKHCPSIKKWDAPASKISDSSEKNLTG